MFDFTLIGDQGILSCAGAKLGIVPLYQEVSATLFIIATIFELIEGLFNEIGGCTASQPIEVTEHEAF